MGLAVGIVLYLSSPGLLRPLKPFRVYFDNAAGIKQGATVMLAGRKIGTVSRIQSPVALKDRPLERPDYEAMVEVQVQSDAQIYKENSVSMRSFGLLAELVVDFDNGNPLSGLAEPNARFVGTRQPDLGEVGPQIIQKLDPALKQAEATLAELQRTSHNLTLLTQPDSPLTEAVKNFRSVGGNLKVMTEKGGSFDVSLEKLRDSLNRVQDITAQVQKDNNLEKMLANFNAASARLKSELDELNGTLTTSLPRLNEIIEDFGELSDKLKHQPWRIVWPTTIKYPQDQQQATPPTPIPVRKRVGQRAP
jgi:phospholipid/cholesterol/gamma-HCH transport system substrate-binding protein